MRLISIVLKIYNQTRPPHQANTEHYIFTPNISNHYKIMTDRSKQIIPDSQAVISFVDTETLEILDLHSTFVIDKLLELVKESSASHTTLELSKTRINNIFNTARSSGGYSNDNFFDDLKQAITAKDKKSVSIVQKLIDGTSCNLLQPEGRGWQKGKVKIYFEFIPEENEPIATQETPTETNPSPLDEIRQLSNELASVGSIDQN
jgi:KGK domain